MPSSFQTSWLGPRVSMRTTLSDSGATIIFDIPSGATFQVRGEQTLSGTFKMQSGSTLSVGVGKFLSRTTTASLTSATLADGELAVGAISASSCIIYFRSGATTYRFIAPVAGAVL